MKGGPKKCFAYVTIRGKSGPGYAAGQWSQTHQRVHLWMVQEKQNDGFGVAKSKSGLKSDWDALAWP